MIEYDVSVLWIIGTEVEVEPNSWNKCSRVMRGFPLVDMVQLSRKESNYFISGTK